jgi:hypothetical protein
VSGLEDSVTLEEVVTAVAQAGGCCAGEVNTHRSSSLRLGVDTLSTNSGNEDQR